MKKLFQSKDIQLTFVTRVQAALYLSMDNRCKSVNIIKRNTIDATRALDLTAATLRLRIQARTFGNVYARKFLRYCWMYADGGLEFRHC